MKRALSVLLVFLTFLTIAPSTSAATACLTVKIGDAKGDPPEQPAECLQAGSLDCKEKPKDYPADNDLKEKIKGTYGITLNGFGTQQMKWVWEKWHCMKGTKFNELVKGSTLVGRPAGSGYSRQVGCPPGTTVELKQYDKEDYFKFIITHELGHAIRNCQPRNKNQYNEHLNAIKKEGAVSYYGGNAASCTGSDNPSEDYADTIAYFMNPQAGLSSGPCGPKNPPNPYYKAEGKDKKPEHLKVAEKVLKK